MPAALSDDKCANQTKSTALTQESQRSTLNSALSVADRDKVEAPNGVTTDDGDQEEGDDEFEDEFFIVETIKNHVIDNDGILKLLVKWEGFDSKKDWTWEPEDNLKVSGDEILNEYYGKIGGRAKIFEESSRAAKTKKRRRATNDTSGTMPKQLQRKEAHIADETLSATAKQWSPPSGSWEDEIETIDGCEEDDNGKLVVYLIWKNGQKTKHDTQVIYKKCPQKMLQFYEQHVKIIRTRKMH
ncbi:hypothetical protein FALCPG4_015223 [Fusarium falciforme]